MNMSYQSNPVGQVYSSVPAYSTEQSISFGNLLYGVWSRKFLILGVFIATMAGVVFWLSTAEPRYTPELRILIESDENPYTQPRSALNQRPTIDPNEVASQVQVLLSNDLAQKVVKDLDLAQYGEFNSAVAPNKFLSGLLELLGLDGTPTEQSIEQNVIEKYFKKLAVYPVTNSRVIVVEFTSSDAELAAKVTNTVGETYVQATREVKYQAAKAAMQWLAAEIGRLRQTVAVSEAAVEEFRARKGLFKSDDTTLDAQELAGINSQIILASAARSEAEARARAIREMLDTKGGVDASSDVLKSTVIQRLREQQVTLQRSVADLEATYLPTHPRMKRLGAEIARLRAQIRAEALKIVESLENEARVQSAREAELRADLAKLKTKATTSNQDEIALRALEREAEANRSLLQNLLQRFTDASARQDISALPAGARIISRAQVLGKPSFPKTEPLLLMGLIGSVLAAILVAFVAEVFSMSAPPVMSAPAAPPRNDPVLREPAVSEPAPHAATPAGASTPVPPPQPLPDPAEFGPILGELEPPLSGGVELNAASSICISDPLSDFALSVRSIYQKMQEGGHAASTRRFAWTCGEDLADRVAILANVAHTFAQNGNKTILVDTDFGSDDIALAFGLTEGFGLAELLAGRAAFTDTIVREPQSGVHILRQGQALEQARSLVGGKRMDTVLDALEGAYEAVIINLAPMGEATAPQVAAKVRYAVILADGSETGLCAGAAAKQLLESAGVTSTAGVVVRGSNVRSSGVLGRLLSRQRKAA